ncbi:nickel-type superoxide dismutase maturation protease [Candidatus Microgenomates bacterium]|nr:nickel-type superoxide dismutase maturation protease [Candidatus Microgenomates bacterium]
MRFVVSGHSMEPNFKEGQIVLISSIPYLFRPPKISDVVVIKDPRSRRLLLKRIISRENQKYFVSGDNPQASTDSRTFGSINKENILGKVIF